MSDPPKMIVSSHFSNGKSDVDGRGRAILRVQIGPVEFSFNGECESQEAADAKLLSMRKDALEELERFLRLRFAQPVEIASEKSTVFPATVLSPESGRIVRSKV